MTFFAHETGRHRTSMDVYIYFPVKTPSDFKAIKKRLIAADPSRIPADADQCPRALDSGGV